MTKTKHVNHHLCKVDLFQYLQSEQSVPVGEGRHAVIATGNFRVFKRWTTGRSTMEGCQIGPAIIAFIFLKVM